ncbi:fibroblast growth factor receptor 3-like isoform X1 [Clavelina lepadiformis]|uniref:fibroblast growth factor receptor 3-like isoform X1 n=1 Tax=Clavelina lepadiformis TaxID=159417 RepID=UPI004041158A
MQSKFTRKAWPNDIFNRTLGQSATFRCSHIRFLDDPRYLPLLKMEWFKNKHKIQQRKKKIKIFGKSAKLSVEGIKLEVCNITEEDSGEYICKLSYQNMTTGFWHYILSMRSQLNVAVPALLVNASTLKTGTWTIENATATNFQTIISNDDDVGNVEKWKVLVVGAIFGTGGFLFITLLCWVLPVGCRTSLNSLGCRKNKPDKEGLSETEWRECLRKNHIPLNIERKDSGIEQEQEIDCMDEERYRLLFPFINDFEWKMLKDSHINRESVKCEVEHSMPIILGTGNFGHVYKGEISSRDGNKRLVAVKRLNDGYKPKELGHFLMEALTLLKAGSHRNVISLEGSILLDTLAGSNAEETLEKPPILLMELADAGNLKHFLQDRRLDFETANKCIIQITETTSNGDIMIGKNLWLKDLTSISRQIAMGMNHLASKKIVHRDLAARNVLLTSNKIVKIADFGLSKHMRNLQQLYYRIHEPEMTPAKWTAPEALCDNIYSLKSDVWSFGVLLWEIFSMGKQPYLGIPVSQLYTRLYRGYRLEQPDFATKATYALMKKCWVWDPKGRTDFSKLIDDFEETLLSVAQPYIDLAKRSDSAYSTISIGTPSDGSVPDSVFLNHGSTSSLKTNSCEEINDEKWEASEVEKQATTFTELLNPTYQV